MPTEGLICYRIQCSEAGLTARWIKQQLLANWNHSLTVSSLGIVDVIVKLTDQPTALIFKLRPGEAGPSEFRAANSFTELLSLLAPLACTALITPSLAESFWQNKLIFFTEIHSNIKITITQIATQEHTQQEQTAMLELCLRHYLRNGETPSSVSAIDLQQMMRELFPSRWQTAWGWIKWSLTPLATTAHYLGKIVIGVISAPFQAGDYFVRQAVHSTTGKPLQLPHQTQPTADTPVLWKQWLKPIPLLWGLITVVTGVAGNAVFYYFPTQIGAIVIIGLTTDTVNKLIALLPNNRFRRIMTPHRSRMAVNLAVAVIRSTTRASWENGIEVAIDTTPLAAAIAGNTVSIIYTALIQRTPAMQVVTIPATPGAAQAAALQLQAEQTETLDHARRGSMHLTTFSMSQWPLPFVVHFITVVNELLRCQVIQLGSLSVTTHTGATVHGFEPYCRSLKAAWELPNLPILFSTTTDRMPAWLLLPEEVCPLVARMHCLLGPRVTDAICSTVGIDYEGSLPLLTQ